ncbi:MAG: ABC transporter ATP-binding protein [Ilumatobacteraceae bacterium]
MSAEAAEGVQPLLQTAGLTVSYGGLRANDRISLKVMPGQIVGLIGPNGAGKTTFIDAITGFTPYTGTVTFMGENLDGRSAHARARRGLSRTWQSIELFSDLTAFENLLVGTRRLTVTSFLLDLIAPKRRRDETNERWALALVGLDALSERGPKELSLGQQKLLSMARALGTRPKVVLLDEPAAGLDNRESAALGERFRNVLDHDISILLIDHDMNLVLDVCDYLYVLEFGRLIAEGTPAEVRGNDDVIAAYLGDEARRAKDETGSTFDGLPT